MIASKSDCANGLAWVSSVNQAALDKTISSSCFGPDTSSCFLPSITDCPSGYLYDTTSVATTAYKCILKTDCLSNTINGTCTSSCPTYGAYYNLAETTGKTAPFDCQKCGVNNCDSCASSSNKAS